jgi:hypothetical protein
VYRSMALPKTILGRCKPWVDASYVLQAPVDHGFDRDRIHMMAHWEWTAVPELIPGWSSRRGEAHAACVQID